MAVSYAACRTVGDGCRIIASLSLICLALWAPARSIPGKQANHYVCLLSDRCEVAQVSLSLGGALAEIETGMVHDRAEEHQVCQQEPEEIVETLLTRGGI
jgi:hypothetical protein